MSSEKLRDLIIAGMKEKKAEDVVVLDLKDIKNAFASYFVICTGNSNTHADSISDSIQEAVAKGIQEEPNHVEGLQNKEWILLDYFDVVAHIFKKEQRAFYALENLWGDTIVKSEVA